MESNENHKKNIYLKELLKKTILSMQRYKNLDILLAGELNSSFELFNSLFPILCKQGVGNIDIAKINDIEMQIIDIIKKYGTESVSDVITLILGKNYLENIKNNDKCDKYDLIEKYFHPIKCRIINKAQVSELSEDYKFFGLDNLTCNNVNNDSKFQLLVYGMEVIFIQSNKVLIVDGIVDDIGYIFLDNNFIKQKHKDIYLKKIDVDYNCYFQRYVNTLTLKELLIYTEESIIQNYIDSIKVANNLCKECLSTTIKDFTRDNIFNQRTTLIQLLLKDNSESKYLAYLLYDLLSNDNNGVIDTYEQTLLYDSLPWILRKYFNEAMKQTIQYTNDLSTSTNNKLPLEQQICLLKVVDHVKEKAMIKLKEVRNKSEDSGAKAKLYLDGLLKIPFGIYREEPILKISKIIKENLYGNIERVIKNFKLPNTISRENVKSNYELQNIHDKLLNENLYNVNEDKVDNFLNNLINIKRPSLIKIINNINSIIKKECIKHHKLIQSGKPNNHLINSITEFIENNKDIFKKYFYMINDTEFDTNELNKVNVKRREIIQGNENIKNYICDMNNVLDKSVYGHHEAKLQIQRIVSQWINGKNTGYCFGFEGPPGVGKTSLAKNGLSKCLNDSNGNARPYSFIAIGGSSNGSIFEGHSYTYVGSTWGKIVDVLIESKCMNPIIFIDELDKISRTENGKEIIGILTHLIDSTQNDKFQDKYFSGIDLDLSKALFIFSYNDPELIDKILLDRIHRIKFDILSLEDKINITKGFLLPDIFTKMGLENMIEMNDDSIKYIIETYTNECGVRKLKELLFEIIGEINVKILKKEYINSVPIILTNDDIKNIYLKKHRTIIYKKINDDDKIGLVNGMWANSIGNGGILPIEVKYFPSSTLFDLKLTGLQGDVMKESMSVSKTVAINLIGDKINEITNELKSTVLQGLHVHCPEGATPKDGPSAGAAITVAIYSLLVNRFIKKDVAITGEINLQGDIMPIGGLDLKITGGVKAGIKTFIFPYDNKDEYDKFIEKYPKYKSSNLIFKMVKNINEVLDIIIL